MTLSAFRPRMRHYGAQRPLMAVFVSGLCTALCLGCSDGPTGRWRPRDAFDDPEVIALVVAAERGDVQAIDDLVERGVDVNAQGKQGMTPLLWAMWAKNKTGFAHLLTRGADPNLVDREGDSVTFLAAAHKDGPFWIETVLKHGGNPNLVARAQKNRTPLFFAIEGRNRRNLERLIKAGADLNHQDTSGDTPMTHASCVMWFDSVYILLKAGADYRVVNKAGDTVVLQTVDAWFETENEMAGWRRKVAEVLTEKGVDLEPLERETLERRKRQVEEWRREGRPELPANFLAPDLGLSPPGKNPERKGVLD